MYMSNSLLVMDCLTFYKFINILILMNSRRSILMAVVLFVFFLSAQSDLNAKGPLPHDLTKPLSSTNLDSPLQAANGHSFNRTAHQSIKWFEAQDPYALTGVALVIHGLNLKPDKMESIISCLTDAGVTVLNLSLYGHGTNYTSSYDIDQSKARIKSFKTVNYSVWSDEAYMAYKQARQKSESNKVPLMFIGFSLGGLIGVDLLCSRADVMFDKSVLFAPALCIHSRAYTLKLLSLFHRILIPSFSPKSYRANNGTPVAAYNSLFEAISHFKKNISPKINIPTLIFIDTKDELVSYKGLKKIKKDKGLDQWRFHIVQKGKNSTEKLNNHLIIDKQSVGDDMWKEIVRSFINHLLPEHKVFGCN